MTFGPGVTSIRARIWLLTGLACTSLVVLGLLLAWSLERSRDANAWVERTHALITDLQAYDGELVTAEASQRGYLLTGQEAYLTPYAAVVADNQALLKRLAAQITDEAARRKLVRLGEIFHDRLEQLGATIDVARTAGPDAARANVRDGRGGQSTFEFQQLEQEIADAERAQLAARKAEVASENRNILAVVMLGGDLAILLIVVAAGRTVERVDAPLRDLLAGIAALAQGRLDRRVDARSSDEIGRVARAFNDMADHLLAANRARQRIEADLAATNRRLLVEVAERGAAQAKLSQSMAELERSNRELDGFAYVASHDLRAPLRGIRNLTDWISQDVAGKVGQDTTENLTLLRNRVDRLDMLLESLLQFARVGRSGGAAEEVDTARLVGEIADYTAPAAGFSVTCDGAMPFIRTRKAPLEQVLRNLIGNGLKHHDGSAGVVTVSARDLGDMIEFQVKDDGPGIAPEFSERIFQMFQTLKPRDQLEGSGMGLAIAKKSVEGQGGTIRVESAPPRRGTAFIFTWPKNSPTPMT
jgi:signal transduction histidine kinase